MYLKKEINDYISSIGSDYLENINYIPPLNELYNYIQMILENIYEKKKIKKHLYKEIIIQYIADKFKDIYGSNYNDFKIINNKNIVEKLKSIPQAEQRTPEWFKLKENSIGASEAASIFGKNAFSSKNELLLKKCGYKKENSNSMAIACLHGTKYEPIVQKLYEIKENVSLLEFGSLPHSNLEMVSASPDGITENGIMIEIKVPISRQITGIPPIYYWIQMHQQMEVCNLDQVHFVECKISEYLNKDSYLSDIFSDEKKDEPINSLGLYKNLIIEYHNLEFNKIEWIYPDKFYNNKELIQWEMDNKVKLEKNENCLYSRTIYWKIEEYSKSEIWRDNNWWNENKHIYTEFWNKVLYYREKGYDELLKPVKKRNSKTPVCIIEDEQ